MTMNANTTTNLQALEAQLKDRGVVDVKFFFERNGKSFTAVSEEAEEMLEAMLEGRFDKAPRIGNACQ